MEATERLRELRELATAQKAISDRLAALWQVTNPPQSDRIWDLYCAALDAKTLLETAILTIEDETV